MIKEGVDDLVLLPKISEDQIVENLKKRYAVCPFATQIVICFSHPFSLPLPLSFSGGLDLCM